MSIFQTICNQTFDPDLQWVRPISPPGASEEELRAVADKLREIGAKYPIVVMRNLPVGDFLPSDLLVTLSTTQLIQEDTAAEMVVQMAKVSAKAREARERGKFLFVDSFADLGLGHDDTAR